MSAALCWEACVMNAAAWQWAIRERRPFCDWSPLFGPVVFWGNDLGVAGAGDAR